MIDAASPELILQQAFERAYRLHQSGNLAETEAAYREVLAIDPGNPAANNNLGNVLVTLGRPAEAEAHYRRALERVPEAAAVHHHLGKALLALGRPEEAERCLRRACELGPDLAEPQADLAGLLVSRGRLAEAEGAFQRAIALNAGSAELHNSLGAVSAMLGRKEGAARHFLQALVLNPDLPEAHCNLGNALKSLGRLEEAEKSLRRALALKPDLVAAHSNLIFLMDLLENCDARSQQEERARWYRQHAAGFAQSIPPHDNVPDPGRRLRIGYVSADFREHSAYFAFGPVLTRHDRSAFEVVCYSGVMIEDRLTARMRQAVDAWRPTVGVTDEALAGQIRRDAIDILVDLSGHSEGNRLLVFARKPAPVQVTAWGHPTGTGVKTIDYFLADPVLVPAEIRPLFAERIFDLPCERCYEPPEYMPAVGPLPALGGRPFTFAYVNRLEKISATGIRLWSRILAAVPEAQLLLKDHMLDDPKVRRRLLDRLAAVGILPGRVRIIGQSTHREHLHVFNEADVCLDPHPQGGAISTAEALFMGVPVVTFCGRTVVSRQGAMNLAALGMHEWIAQTEDDYVRIAVSAARDLPRLAALRLGMRTRIAKSVFGDPPRFTRAVEGAYRAMWREWCGGDSQSVQGEALRRTVPFS